MSLSPITIVGAGLAGLTLGRSLRQKGVPAVLYERASSTHRYHYGITLQSAIYQKLLPILELDENTFHEKVAVHAPKSEKGHFFNTYFTTDRDSLRCNRGSLESLLREGQDIRWNHTLEKIELSPQPSMITASFQDKGRIDCQFIIGCDGPHSLVRQSLSTMMKLRVLPYVAFNGKRRYSPAEYNEKLAPHLEESIGIQTRKGGVRLEISLNEYTASKITVSYTYSRPARDGNDPLYNPERATSGATDIPEEFYEELDELRITEQPYADIFDSKNVRKDRVLHWLMRGLMPNLDEARRLAAQGVIFIGDALHAVPILGGEGANVAIADGLELAEHIAERGLDDVQSFLNARFETWRDAVTTSEHRLEEMHSISKSAL
jgi:2-polyprenyl-6-methoxyphenol hydroxylase-like FAD-dependent oxidoreductase